MSKTNIYSALILLFTASLLFALELPKIDPYVLQQLSQKGKTHIMINLAQQPNFSTKDFSVLDEMDKSARGWFVMNNVSQNKMIAKKLFNS